MLKRESPSRTISISFEIHMRVTISLLISAYESAILNRVIFQQCLDKDHLNYKVCQKKVGLTATITSSKSHFFGGHLVVVCIWSSDLVDPLSLVFLV